jgi:hypothetical protein
MSLKSTVPPEFLENLDYTKDPLVARLLEMVVGLGGEVFLLKAELERLKAGMAAKNLVSGSELDAAAQTEAFRQWLAKEQETFALHLLDPIARGRSIARPGQQQD